jgi:hypothetical protein
LTETLSNAVHRRYALSISMPYFIFKCRKCRNLLFSVENIVSSRGERFQTSTWTAAQLAQVEQPSPSDSEDSHSIASPSGGTPESVDLVSGSPVYDCT